MVGALRINAVFLMVFMTIPFGFLLLGWRLPGARLGNCCLLHRLCEVYTCSMLYGMEHCAAIRYEGSLLRYIASRMSFTPRSDHGCEWVQVAIAGPRLWWPLGSTGDDYGARKDSPLIAVCGHSYRLRLIQLITNVIIRQQDFICLLDLGAPLA